MTHLMYQFPGGYFKAEYKQYYVNSIPSSFSNLVKERIKATELEIDDQITLAQINAFIDEVTDLECARLRMKKEFKQVKGFNSSFYNKETKSKDFRCARADKKCPCKVKNRNNKFDKYEYEVVYCNRFEKHDIPIFEYMQYESEEDEISDSTSSESTTEVVSTFSDDTSSVMFNMVRKPYAYPKKAKKGVTVLTKEQVAKKELKYSEPYILPPANAKLQPMESASNWHPNALKEIAKLQYSIISRIDAMVKAKQSATLSTSAAPRPTASQQLVLLNYNTSASSSILPRMFLALQSSAIETDGFPRSESPFIEEDLADAFNPSSRWGNLANNLSTPHHRCAAADKNCSCKVKNRRNKFNKKYKVARRTRKLTKEEQKKVRYYICQKEGHIAHECPKRKKRFGNAVLKDKYEYEVVYYNRFEKHDIPIFEYLQYEFEEDEISDSTSFESTTEAVSTFSDDTSSVMFNMVCKPYAFPKKAKVRTDSSSSTPFTTLGSEESKPSWMKKRRPSTLNLSKKEQRDYMPLPLFSNMVEQAEEIAKTEEWHKMIHPGLIQNSGYLPSPIIQQTTSTNFSIPKTSAKPSPSVAKKQSVKAMQDRNCVEEHQLKAIQAMFSALEQINNRIEQLHKLVLNTQSQSASIEAKVDQCHGELQYLIDKAAMSKIAKEPVSGWKLQRPVNTCQIIPFNEKEHVSYFSEVWIKLPKSPSFRVDALWDRGAALSYLNQELVPFHPRQKLHHGIPVSYANNPRGQINQIVQCQIALTNLKAQVTLYLHPHPNTDLTIGSDVISKLTPWAIQLTGSDSSDPKVVVGVEEEDSALTLAFLGNVYGLQTILNVIDEVSSEKVETASVVDSEEVESNISSSSDSYCIYSEIEISCFSNLLQ
ncbi:hypothetical protein L7F22_015820 [Adiantum nelumboides]|nr:hypothetical protein [Adiantum nelumboides]